MMLTDKELKRANFLSHILALVIVMVVGIVWIKSGILAALMFYFFSFSLLVFVTFLSKNWKSHFNHTLLFKTAGYYFCIAGWGICIALIIYAGK